MNETHNCPTCGVELPQDSSVGLCPKCLLEVGLEQSTQNRHHDGEDLTLAGGSSRVADDPTISPSGTAEHDSGVGSNVRYFGDYELVEEIARGGMGVVYKARQTSLNRIVALKMILSGQLASKAEVQRFRSEAEAAANLQHPNIVAIHEVGQHNGQHYFSMDYVAGQHLGEVIRETTLPPQSAATHTMAIARAVQYAHQQGVLHRDLKPSNILVQERVHDTADNTSNVDTSSLLAASRLKITDFGLAKRLDGGSDMTATGQTLGTPSYMPPEQAAGNREAVGPASDVYSIGAILYELITGRPPFRAATPLDTIMQVLEQQPVAPRLLNPNVPRDLETICLKCLEKDPSRRYATAASLAEDLERFCKGDAITARPISLTERSWRWLRRQRRSVALGAAVVVITTLLCIAGSAGWFWYANWRLGYVSLRTLKPPIAAEVLDQDGHPVTPTFSIPTPAPIALPADQYQLRLTSPGRMSQSYHATVARGNKDHLLEFKLNLEDQLLWPSISIERTYEILELEGDSADLIMIDNAGLQRFRSADVRYPVWTLNIVKPVRDVARALGIPVDPKLQGVHGLRWPWSSTEVGYIGPGKTRWQPTILKEAPDIDQDGIGDVVLAARHQAWLIAVSGSTGDVIWVAPRGSDLLDRPAVLPENSKSDHGPQDQIHSATLGTPQLVADVDGDGIGDLLTTFVDRGQVEDQAKGPRRWVELVSGASGQSIWQFQIEDSWFEDSSNAAVPMIHRWFSEWSGYGQLVGGSSSNDDQLIRFGRNEIDLQGTWCHVPLPARELDSKHGRLALLVVGERLLLIDVRTGRQEGQTTETGFLSQQRPQVMNADGDDAPQVLLVEQQQPSQRRRTVPKMRLVVQSLGDVELRWEHMTNAELFQPPQWSADASQWPLVADLDGDHHLEVIVPGDNSMGMRQTGRASITPWGEIKVLNGTDGSVRWRRRLKTMDQQLDRFLVGPDLNGDGHAELFVATLIHTQYDLFVDALSGKDGQRLWWSSTRIGREVYLNSLRFWGSAIDGMPQLLVRVTPADWDDGPSTLFSFSTATGRYLGEGPGLEDIRLADGNGDDVDDLFGFQPRKPQNLDFGGTLHAIQRSPSEVWRWLGGKWLAGDDYDADGYSDALNQLSDRDTKSNDRPNTLVAISGRTGKQVWSHQLRHVSKQRILPLSTDLNGDQKPDLIAHYQGLDGGVAGGGRGYPLEAISGSDGKRLWSLDVKVHSVIGTPFVDSRDLNEDGEPEVIILCASDWGFPNRRSFGSDDLQLMLAVLSGRNGEVLWKEPLTLAYGLQGSTGFLDVYDTSLKVVYANLDNDDVLDLVVAGEDPEDPQRLELRALSGRNGSPLWQRKLPPPSNNSRGPFKEVPAVLAVDLNLDGKEEVVYLAYDSGTNGEAGERLARLVTLEGHSGSLKWSWETEVEGDYGQIEYDSTRRERRPMPVLLRTASGPPLICLWFWGQPGQLVVVDGQGQLVGRQQVDTPEDTFRPRVLDLDGDSSDEMLVSCNGRIEAYGTAGGVALLWKAEIPPGSVQELVDVLPTDSSGPVVVVVRSENSVYGISGENGQLIWSCQGPTPRDANGIDRFVDGVTVLPFGSDLGSLSLPLVAFHQPGAVTVCRRVKPVAESSNQTNIDTPLASSAYSGADPRSVRPAPWAMNEWKWRRYVQELSWGVTVAAFLILLPLRFFGVAARQKTWNLRWLLMLPVVFGIALVLLRMEAPRFVIEPVLPYRLLSRLAMALQYLPMIILPVAVFQAYHRGRWRIIASLLGFAAVFGTLFTIVPMFAASSLLVDGERFSWQGWYVPFVTGGWYASGLIATLAIFVRTFYLSVRRVAAQDGKVG